jgi:TRAP-type C4-dicarboxylate transport system substrate-binding protein
MEIQKMSVRITKSTSRARQRTRGIAAVAATFAIASSLAACGGGEGEGGSATEWDYFIFVPTSHPIGQQALQFAEEAAVATDGELKINVRGIGELPYTAADALTAVANGDVDMADGYWGFILGDAPSAGVVGLPLLASDQAETDAAVEAIGPYLEKDFDKYNADVLYSFNWGMQELFGKGDPVEQPDDLAGRRIRGNSPVQGVFVEAMEGHASNLTTGEVATALSTGVMDSVFSTPMNITGSGWDDYIEWRYGLAISPGMSFVAVNEDSMSELSEESQTALKELASDFSERETASLAKTSDEALAEMTSGGLVSTDPTEADMDQMLDEVSPLWDDWAEETGTEEALEAALEALSE